MRRLAPGLAVLAIAFGAVSGAPATTGNPTGDGSANRLTLAVIGDTPYGPAQLAAFPQLVADVNGDPKVDLALHLGDIKTGSSPCDDGYFAQVRSLFDTFKDPLVYTPGDNEWTDCHRAAAGGYLPTERLARLRSVFYPKAGVTLGHRSKRVLTQADVPGFEPFVENQLWLKSKVVFSALHVVGSNNDLAPWFGPAETDAQRAERLAEYEARLAADLAWLDRTFKLASKKGARGVVIAMQADMWDASSPPANLTGFRPIVQRLAELAAEFERPVLLLEGDSHDFLVDRPLAAGDPIHGVTIPVPNLTRVVVEGETASEWLRLTIEPRSPELFSLERVQV